MSVVFKICDKGLWEESCKAGVFTGSEIDLEDGYIHFSTAGQVAETAFLHFRGIEGLVLIAVREDAVQLTWEESRGGKLFPHLYRPLPVKAALWVEDLKLGENGLHEFPPGLFPLPPEDG